MPRHGTVELHLSEQAVCPSVARAVLSPPRFSPSPLLQLLATCTLPSFSLSFNFSTPPPFPLGSDQAFTAEKGHSSFDHHLLLAISNTLKLTNEMALLEAPSKHLPLHLLDKGSQGVCFTLCKHLGWYANFTPRFGQIAQLQPPGLPV